MYTYRAFGLDIRSALPLPELLPGGGNADVEIRHFRQHDGAALEGDAERMISPTEWQLEFPEVGTLTVRRGREIVVASRPRADARSVRIAVLGPAMGALLQQRGYLVLHASVVDVAGHAVAFLGASGAGKSTMAAAMHARGHDLVADDFAALRTGPEGVVVHSGFPQFKLWPDSAKAVGRDPRTLPHLDRAWAKRAAPVQCGFAGDCTLPLDCIFLLDQGEELRSTPVAPSEAFLALVQHTYGIEWLHVVSGEAQFAVRAAVARTVAVRKLTRPWMLAELSSVAALVEQEVGAHAHTR